MRTPDGLFLWQGDRSLSEYETHFETAFLDSTLKQSM